MNVEHRCPAVVDPETGERCNNRYMLVPGNPYNNKCNYHPEETLVQTEAWGGADFLNVDEAGNTMSRGHVPTPGAQNIPKGNFTDVPDTTRPVPEAERRATLVNEYQLLTQEDPNPTWTLPTLAAQVSAIREQQKLERVQREEAAHLTNQAENILNHGV